MKKNSFLLNLLGIALCCGPVAQIAADSCYPTSASYCDWSFCDGKITLGADWLYWQVQEDGLNLGTAETATPNFGLATDLDKHNTNPKFQYENGYRVNIGYELPCDSWDLDIAYTYMPASARTPNFSSDDTTTGQFFVNSDSFPILDDFDNSGIAQGFSGKWDANLNCVDVDMGRTVCFGECLKIRPHIGFRAAWMDQKLYANLFVNVDTTETVDNLAKMKETFTGYGVEGGLWGDWQLGCGFSVIGHVGGSILYSEFNIHQSSLIVTTTGIGSDDVIVAETTSRLSETIHTGTPTMDYFVGLQYDDCFCDMLFSMVAGWEQHIIFDANRLSTHRGNLVTQGLTLGMQVGF
ncbi:MAG: Lpg1974 family pore-forming outer membrane protein [Parachlamydiaceae bacterium]